LKGEQQGGSIQQRFDQGWQGGVGCGLDGDNDQIAGTQRSGIALAARRRDMKVFMLDRPDVDAALAQLPDSGARKKAHIMARPAQMRTVV
jgi:hypothetical protein